MPRSSRSRSRAGPRLVGVVEREPHDRGGGALLGAGELAGLDLRAEVAVTDVHPAEGDVLLEHRRAHAARDDAHLVAADVDAVAVTGGLVALQLETDQHALRMRPSLGERLTTDEVVVLVGRDGEADSS